MAWSWVDYSSTKRARTPTPGIFTGRPIQPHQRQISIYTELHLWATDCTLILVNKGLLGPTVAAGVVETAALTDSPRTVAGTGELVSTRCRRTKFGVSAVAPLHRATADGGHTRCPAHSVLINVTFSVSGRFWDVSSELAVNICSSIFRVVLVVVLVVVVGGGGNLN